ncbi:MAG TPA: hypothetical protein VFV38_34870 [Ktedonobacteraceae bacterium]|nr:hypothetical protein [Ktedonobacteraceae bacterium]
MRTHTQIQEHETDKQTDARRPTPFPLQEALHTQPATAVYAALATRTEGLIIQDSSGYHLCLLKKTGYHKPARTSEAGLPMVSANV